MKCNSVINVLFMKFIEHNVWIGDEWVNSNIRHIM